MGNENSQPASSSATTPASEGQSVYSFGSVRRSSAASSQHSSPVEAPQPDLSHLTEDEISQIRSVIDRAKQIQVDEANRVRQIEEDYTTYAADIVRKSSWSEIENEGKIMCPICNTTELTLNSDGTRTNQNVCKDCEEITCDECGDYAMSQTTKLQEWVCHLCRKRRVLVASTGLWFHGRQRNPDSIILQEIESKSPSLENTSQINQEQSSEPIAQEFETAASKSEIQPAPVGATAGAYVEPTTSQPPLPPPRRKHKKDDPSRQKATQPVKGSETVRSEDTPPVRGSEAVRREAAAHANAAVASKHRRREQVKRAKSVPESDQNEPIKRDASLPVEEEKEQPKPPASVVGPGDAKAEGPPGPPCPPPRRKQPASSSVPVPSSKREERRARKEAEDNVDSSVVFPCRSSAGSSGLRGVLLSMVGPCGATAGSSRSESECSSLISDVDWEEMSMSKYRNELTSPDEVSIASSGEEEEESTGNRVVRRKHRPKYLNINRSLSVTSSEDEGDEKLSRLESEKSSKESRRPTGKAGSSTKPGAKIDPEDTMKPSGIRDGSRQHADTDPSLQQQQQQQQQHQQQPPQQQQHQQQQQQQHMDYLSDGKPVRSPSPPRSPSWREGLESPPFSPRRRDSCPGKKRGHVSPVSPKDKKFQFSYVDTSPTVHPHHSSTEDIYESNHQGLSYREDELSPPRSPLTPDELKKAFVAACGQATHRDNSSRDILRKSSSSSSASSPSTHQRENAKKDKSKLDLGMDTEVIDLATYAATIASNTACLTSLSVSPTNIHTTNIESSEIISPESITSTDSTSPVSPNYYDSSRSEEVEDVELADPATKSIDYQGTKRQKQRPPSSDWSPVMDLSPILDVSPSVEEAEQQEMLAQQQEVLRKRESELISESDEEDEDSSSPEKKNMDKYVIPSLRRYMNFEDISKICEGKIPDEKKLERISDMLSDFQKINRDMEILTYPVLRSSGDREHIVTTTPPTIATRSTTSDVVATLPIARPPSATYTMAPISTVVTTSPASTTTISITDEEETDRVLHPLPARGMRPTISTSSLSELLDSGGEDSELMTVWNLAQANVISKPTPSLQTSTSVVTATSLAMSATVVTSAATTCTVSRTDRPDGPPPPPKKPVIAPKPTPPAKPQPAIPAKPTEAGGTAKTAEAKPEPPPRVRRKLPEPTAEIMATQKPPKPPKPARTPSTCSLLTPTTKTAPIDVVPGQPTRPLPPPPPPSKSVKMLTEGFEVKIEAERPPEVKPKPPVPEKKPPKPSVDPKPGKTLAPKPEPDKRRSKEIKIKVKPSAIESEPPQAPKVLDSPVTPPEPAVSNLKREYSDSTSVSPSSSPDHEIYTYPSPGTPPESDISPPKAPSPPSPRGEPARGGRGSSRSQNDTKRARSAPPYTKPNAPEPSKPKDSGKKIRRKLPPIPADEEPATAPRAPAQKKSPSSSVPPAPSRKAPTIKAVKGSPHGDNETVSLKDDSSREAGHPSRSVGSTGSSHSGVGRTNGNHSLRANGAGNGSGAGPCTSKQKNAGGPNGTTSKGGNGRNGRQPDGGAMKGPSPSNSRMGSGNGGRQPSAVNGRKTSEKQGTGKHDAKPMAGYSSSTVEQKVGDRRSRLHSTPPGSLSDEFTQDDNDQIIDSLVGIYGIPISTAMKSLKRRLQDELRKVTESRRRKIEELEEIHALERQIEELKLESKLDSRAAALLASGHKSRTLPRNGRGLVTSSSFDKSAAPVRSSPQIIPRRSRHRRQASDPMIAKFSPIKEDKDIEADFQARGATEVMEGKFSKYTTDDSSQSGLGDTESTRSEPTGETINSAYKKIKPSACAKMFYTGRAQSTERIHPADSAQYLSTSAPLSSSHSESYLADGLAGHLKTPAYFSDDEEKRTKEEKRQILQYEIEKRKKQLEETARLQHELIRLSRARQAVAHSYDDIPRRYAYSTSPRHVPTGIIGPLDDDLPPQLERFVQSTHDIRKSESMDAKRVQELYQAQANYSSTEYLAHKQELARRQLYDDYSTYGSYPPYDAGLSQSQVYPSSPNLMNRSDSGPVIIPSIPQGLHPPGITGSVTLPEINRSDMDIMPARELHQHQFSSDTDNSPASDYTPAMPLLDDITTRSRKILHDIGSRPLSAEFNLPGGVDDLMNAMYRVESDNSVDADEPIMKHMMEGGVTILEQLERKKQPAPTQPKRYPFVTKRILLTRDPKDKSIKGNGIGMKIVGGKHQGPDEEMVAYVAAIYPGGIAEQLHGELEEGDQILEWNGIELTGKTYEEVQQIISQPNGEIELVVRPGTKLCPKDGEGSNLQDGSCHSSYDNLEYISDDDDEYDRCMGAIQHGIDPEQLAAQLEGIRDPACTSPGDSPSGSSQQEYFLTPSMSTSACSTPHSDLTTSTSSERQRHAIDKTVIPEDSMGDLQLQLNFDDFDNTLNVFVIQARNLLRRDFSGLSDPFVKVYLLPGRSPDHKRRTRYVSCTLNPEWHQNLVFQNQSRDDLKNKILEITVWDYDRFKPNDFLGQVVIDLNDEFFLDGTPHWYPLCQQDDNHSSTDLPKPTVGPHSLRPLSAADIQHARKVGDFSSLPRRPVGRSHHPHQHPESGPEPVIKRRKSLGTLPEDRLQPEKTVDISSTRSSPIPQYIQRDSHSPLIHQNRRF